MSYEGKHILVLGLGRSGLAAARLLKRVGAIVSAADSGMGEPLQERARLLRAEGITVHLGFTAENDPSFYEIAVLSPGIEENVPLVRNVTRKGIPLIGEIELAASLCSAPIVAITGSNGKTTTTELTTLALQGGGLAAVACGNIGLPFSEAILNTGCREYDVFVVEVSSFQLETIKNFHPKIAVWLNFSANHLDRYASMDEYRAAKLNIFRNQTTADIAVIPTGFDRAAARLQASCVTFSAKETDGTFSFEKEQICFQKKPFLNIQETRLRGLHNVENLMAAFAVGVSLNLPLEPMAEAVKKYTPPPHRCEFVTKHDGITWINDSKATTLDAMEKALCSIEKTSPLILIAGGKNKGSSFVPLLPFVEERVKEAVLIGELQDSIALQWPSVLCRKAESLEEAVVMAAASAISGDTILLSPGTSSYDMFSNYEERGERFKQAVHEFCKTKLVVSS